MPFAFIARASGHDQTSPAVTATRLDGVTLSGALERWTNEQITITTASGPQTVAIDQLLSLRWLPSPAPSAPQDAKPPLVELVDGSILPIEDFRVAGGKATVTIAAASGSKPLSIDVKQISAVRLKSISAAVAPQWDEIRAQNLASDVLVVLKREGQSLDYAEGVMGDVNPEKIDFQLDGKPARIDRAQAAGVIYFRRARSERSEPRRVIAGRGGLRANVAQVALEGDTLRMKTLPGVELAWPLADIYLADFSAGKLVYLSDLEPSSQKWTPLVGLPAAAKAAAAYGRPRRDLSAFGRSLALWFPEEAAGGGPGHERSFAKGLAVRSRTELVYRLPAGFRRFVAVAGIDPAASAVGNVMLVIQGDNRVLLETEIAGNRPPLPIDVSIEGVRRLSIVVDYGRNLDNGDWLNLCDARIVK
ncbi:MAG: NPCBM/NEW2 domain-containing protein [Pirellulales bacterium]